MKENLKCILISLMFILPLSACSEANSEANSERNPCLNTSVKINTQGIPYQSDTEDGRSVIGTASIDNFEADGDDIIAVGTFTCGETTFNTEYPVQIIDSTCEDLIMKIGPPTNPPGLVSTTEIGPGTGLTAGSELRISDLCGIAHAYVSGDTELLVDRLNEEEKVKTGAVASCCPWYKALECTFAIITCQRVCSISPPPLQPCVDCLEKAGSKSCACCL